MGFEVLIVDDDSAFASLVELRLSALHPDLVCTKANSVAAALKILESKRFALIVLDQHLGDGRGIEVLKHPHAKAAAVLAMSSDDAPEIPADAVLAGAEHFLSKNQLRDKLFLPLVAAIVKKKELEREALEAHLRAKKLETIRKLVSTLRHEINNPLGAVLGGAYLVKSSGRLDSDQHSALEVIEKSGKRIHHVLLELCRAAEVEEVLKADEEVFQIPGDPKWSGEDN